MKHLLLLPLFISYAAFAQGSIDQILLLGVDDAQQFNQHYFAPVGEGVVNAMSNGWYNTAAVKKLFHFEIGLVGNASFVRDEKQSFILNQNDYDNFVFSDGEVVKDVANVFGENREDIILVVNPGRAGEVQIALPNGLNGAAINFMPTTFLQASMGLIKGTEVKARFWPKVVGGKTKVQLYGVGIQHELSTSIFSWKRSLLHISALIGYTNIRANHDLAEDSNLAGQDQEIVFKGNSWLVSGIVSTKLPVLNFYAGFGFYTGSGTIGLEGTYLATQDVGSLLANPIPTKEKESGLKATMGMRVDLRFFKVNLDYSLQNYSTLSLGVHVGW